MDKKKILLVDDSKTSLFMERMILQRGPYTLLTAQDGVEAVERATADRPDLILMDVVMPRMTGIEALRELRVTTMVVTPQLLEIFWTAITREVDRQGKTATFERARGIARRPGEPPTGAHRHSDRRRRRGRARDRRAADSRCRLRFRDDR